MPTPEPGTPEWLAAELLAAHLLDEPTLRAAGSSDRWIDAHALGESLVGAGSLTRYQLTRALDGEARALVLGPYVLQEPIGGGGLYRACGRADRSARFAVRVLPRRDHWNVRLARQQVRAFAAVPAHPAVVPFLDVGSAGGAPYLVWPFAEGQSLAEVVAASGRLEPAAAVRVFLPLAEALELCHARGLSHGLIKPSNVVVGPDGGPRLLDFGMGALLAENDEDRSLVDTLSQASQASGMLDCASPESLADPADRTPAGDQYSLGCVLFFALTGSVPFPRGTAVDKMRAHQTQAAPAVESLNPAVPAALAAVVDRLLHKAPEARFRSATELRQALENLRRVASCERGTRASGSAVASEEANPISSSLATRNSQLATPSGWLRKLQFWKRGDRLECSVFAPAAAAAGETVTVRAYLHKAGAADSVGGEGTRSTAALGVAVDAGTRLALHLGLSHFAAEEPLREITWGRELAAVAFRVAVPWSAAAGAVRGAVTVGRDNVLVGRTEFEFRVGGRDEG